VASGKVATSAVAEAVEAVRTPNRDEVQSHRSQGVVLTAGGECLVARVSCG
jgi:hypothetical protein